MSDWVNTSLGKLGKFSTSSVDKKVLLNQKIVRLVNYMDVYNSNSIDSTIDFMYVSASEVERTRSQVKVGDILFTPSSETPDDIGYSAVVCEDLENTLHSYHTVRYRPHNDQTFDIRFSAWFCNSVNIRKQFEQKCAGSIRYTLSIPSFTSVQISIPESKKEQGKIAKYLDMIQQTIEKTEALIAKYQLIKAGLMQDLFTRGIGVDGKLRPTREQAPELYQETEIGWIPKDWELKTCGETFDIDSGITLGLHRRPKNNARPYLRVANVYKEKIRMDDISYLEADAQENEKYALKTHDLLIVEGHANIQQIGRCAIVDSNAEGMLFQNHLFRLKTKDTSSYFGMYMLNSYIARKYWERNCSTSSGLNTINKTMLRKMPILVPSQNEQEAIVEKINTIVNKIDNERRLFHKLNSQKQGLMHDLLTGKKRVTVDEVEADHV